LILSAGQIAVIKELEGNWDEHYFRIVSVEPSCITGFAISGELQGLYGEPDFSLIKETMSEKEYERKING
jgi:hypothetical protein